MIVTTHPDRLATAILEALSEAGTDYAVSIGPSPSGGYLIELHDLAESTEHPCMATGESETYSVAVAELVVNLLVDRREALELAAELELVQCPSERYDGACIHQAGHDGKHYNGRRSWVELDAVADPTPPHGLERPSVYVERIGDTDVDVVDRRPLETRAAWTERAS